MTDDEILDGEAAVIEAREEERLRRTAERVRHPGTVELWAGVVLAKAVAEVLKEVCNGG